MMSRLITLSIWYGFGPGPVRDAISATPHQACGDPTTPMPGRRRSSPARRGDQAVELVAVRCAGAGTLDIEHASLDELRETLFEREGSVLPREGDLLIEVLQRVLANVLPRAVADHQQFDR